MAELSLLLKLSTRKSQDAGKTEQSYDENDENQICSYLRSSVSLPHSSRPLAPPAGCQHVSLTSHDRVLTESPCVCRMLLVRWALLSCSLFTDINGFFVPGQTCSNKLRPSSYIKAWCAQLKL